MQLNSGVSGSDLQSEINVTPLVDVVLVLLIIFMVVVPLLLQGYDANIARTSANPVPAQAEESQLILSIVPTACRILEPPPGDGLPADCRVHVDTVRSYVEALSRARPPYVHHLSGRRWERRGRSGSHHRHRLCRGRHARR